MAYFLLLMFQLTLFTCPVWVPIVGVTYYIGKVRKENR